MVVRQGFSGSIPLKFEDQLRRLRKDLRTITSTYRITIQITITPGLSQQRNDAISYFTCIRIPRLWELFFQTRSRELFPLIAASMFVKFKRNLIESPTIEPPQPKNFQKVQEQEDCLRRNFPTLRKLIRYRCFVVYLSKDLCHQSKQEMFNFSPLPFQ